MTKAALIKLLERDRELVEIEGLIDAACGGSGGLLLIEGPAGIGKTELLTETADRARSRGMLVLAARASEIDRELPFGIIRQLFQPLVAGDRGGALRGAAGLAAPLLGMEAAGAPGAGADPSVAYFHALYWLAANLADDGPTALVLDDAHWADQSSQRFLQFLLPRLQDLGLLLALATRIREPGTNVAWIDAIAGDPLTTVVRPADLSERAVRDLTAAELAQDPDPAFVAACREATGGNPFLVRELLDALAAEQTKPTREQASSVKQLAPATIARAVLVRLARLEPRASTLARAVAVLGDQAPLRRAAALADLGEDEAAELSDALAAAGILSPARPLEFRHPILRTAVYADLGPSARSRAHRRAARLLAEEGAAPQEVAVHLLETDPAGEPSVVATLTAAAAAALERGAIQTAVRCLRRALDEPPSAPERPALLQRLASAELHAGDPAAAVEHFDEAARVSGEPTELAAGMRERMFALAACGRLRDAFDAGERAVAELQQSQPQLALLVETFMLALAPFDWSRLPWFQQRLERYRGNLKGDSAGDRMLLATQTWFDAYYGDQPAAQLADAAELALGAGRLLEDTGGEFPPFFFALAVLVLADRRDTARRELDRAVAEARRRGRAPGFALASGWRSWLLAREGKLVEAEADARICADLALPSGWFVAGPAMLGFILDVLVDRGELADAEQLLAESGMAAREADDNPTFDPVVHARARIRAGRGDLAGARADIRAVLERGYRWNTLEARQPPVLVAPELVGEDQAQARDDVERLLSEARVWGTARALGMALRASAALEPGPSAIALLEEAAATLASSPLERARALADLGAAVRRGGNRAAARDHLRVALDLADACGARPLAERTRHELRAAGGRPRRPRITGADALTASERRIAGMAADGLSNPEIAQALFVTKKTVESHLANAYRKLDIQSRTEIAGALRAPDRASSPD